VDPSFSVTARKTAASRTIPEPHHDAARCDVALANLLDTCLHAGWSRGPGGTEPSIRANSTLDAL
jgi:hypothetical protein